MLPGFVPVQQFIRVALDLASCCLAGAVKYHDLLHRRMTPYKFSYDLMLDMHGYALKRIDRDLGFCSR